MSAVKVEPTRTPQKSKPRRIHYSHKADAAAAYEMGVQVRMFCGFWKFPSPPMSLRRIKTTSDLRPSVDCKRCMAVARRMARERGIA